MKNTNTKRISMTISKDIDLEFRKIASLKLNFSNRWYSTAVEEAMLEYIENHKNKQVMEVI